MRLSVSQGASTPGSSGEGPDGGHIPDSWDGLSPHGGGVWATLAEASACNVQALDAPCVLVSHTLIVPRRRMGPYVIAASVILRVHASALRCCTALVCFGDHQVGNRHTLPSAWWSAGVLQQYDAAQYQRGMLNEQSRLLAVCHLISTLVNDSARGCRVRLAARVRQAQRRSRLSRHLHW